MRKLLFRCLLTITVLLAIIMAGFKVNCQDFIPQNLEPALTKVDSIFASELPKLKLPQEYILRGGNDLPYRINNAELPFFRPVFSQSPFWNCGQSAGVGYNFCYELNRIRNLPGNLPENQASIHFTWNFMNTGDGWGVSYFHSFNILKACGNPNLDDYGGLFYGGDKRWMTGYDLYEDAMLNRISDVYTIDVSTPEGLLTLKHWLNDHLNGSYHGGVANFYLSFYQYNILPDDSPESGLPVIVECRAPAGHALTIVGYNDSVRFDVNNDGRYTNDVDINNDGIVDMKDWEIGALRYVNSTEYLDGNGFLLYRTLALKYGEGGIWNQQVHVIDVKEVYEPIVTMRLKIKHNSRNKLKLIAGISQDISSGIPEHSIDFPIFNYQGGDHYMQGDDSNESNKTIELSLDISPLLSFIEPGSNAKYFIQIAEKDEFDAGQGEVLYFSVVDYQNSKVETTSDQFPKPIANNTLTILYLDTKIDYDKVNITTKELLAVDLGEKASSQISAEGGQPPYSWDVLQAYRLSSVPLNFPGNLNNQLPFQVDDFYGIAVELPFDFPFYNDTVSRITVFKDGFIMFDEEPFPYPYYIGETSMLKNRKSIAPFMAVLLLYEEDNDGVWVNQYDDYIEVIWKASFEWFETSSNVEFAVRLYPDGNIETHFGEMVFPGAERWCSGVSNGDNMNYTLNTFYHQIGNHSYEAFEYKPPQILPDKIEIDQNGLLSMNLPDDSEPFDILVQATDNHGVIDSKYFQVPSGLVFEFEISSGDDAMINHFDTASVKFIVKNISDEIYQNIDMNFSTNNSYFSLLKNYAHVGTLLPQQSKVIDSALVFMAHPDIPDQYISSISNILSSDEKHWSADVGFTVNSPVIRISDLTVSDNHNGLLEPGETAELEIAFANYGHADIDNFKLEMYSYENYLDVENPIISINKLAVGDTTTIIIKVEANQNILQGTEIEVYFNVLKNNNSITKLGRELMIGKTPVLILDLDPKKISGPVFRNLLDSLQMVYIYSKYYPDNYDHYMAVFVCLGTIFNNVELNTDQANKLNSFLTDGGKIYMEGRQTWYADIPNILHEQFNIDAIGDGTYFEFDSIYGINIQFTSEMTFGYNSSILFNNHCLLPIGNAFPVFNSVESDSACAIAYDEGSYKTIGSSFEFGSLVDTDSISTRKNYLLGILDFFELTDYLLSYNPISAPIADELKINAYPNPFKNRVIIELINSVEISPILQILDLSGRVVYSNTLAVSNNANGIIISSWDGRDQSGNELPKGLYFIRISSENHTFVKKILYH